MVRGGFHYFFVLIDFSRRQHQTRSTGEASLSFHRGCRWTENTYFISYYTLRFFSFLISCVQDSARENNQDSRQSTEDMQMVLAEIERDLKTEVDRRRREVGKGNYPIDTVGNTYQNYAAIKKLFYVRAGKSRWKKSSLHEERGLPPSSRQLEEQLEKLVESEPLPPSHL